MVAGNTQTQHYGKTRQRRNASVLAAEQKQQTYHEEIQYDRDE